MADIRRPLLRNLLLGASLAALAACGGGTGGSGLDLDLRGLTGNSLDTSEASRQATQDRPRPDDRGVISYPSFDVAVARRGDTVAILAARIGIGADEIARYNGLQADTRLRRGEVVALPTRLADAPPAAAEDVPPGGVDIAALAGGALNRAPADSAAAPPPVQSGPEPVQHQVVRGETAYSIARLYNVSVRSLADWNGLGPDLNVREGQFLLIPLAVSDKAAAPAPEETTATSIAPEEIETVSLPGEGSAAPEPPSASTPLPEPEPEVATPAPAIEAVPTPDLGEERTAASASRFVMPVNGAIIRDYNQGVNDGIGIAASPGTAVRAAGDGTVAAITRDTDGVPILVLRHSGNLLTVYANIEDVAFEKDQRVSQGQTIAKVRSDGAGFLHFEVREGFDSVDPIKYLN